MDSTQFDPKMLKLLSEEQRYTHQLASLNRVLYSSALKSSMEQLSLTLYRLRVAEMAHRIAYEESNDYAHETDTALAINRVNAELEKEAEG